MAGHLGLFAAIDVLNGLSHLILGHSNRASALVCLLSSEADAGVSAQSAHRGRQKDLVDLLKTQVGRLRIEEIDDRTEQSLVLQ